MNQIQLILFCIAILSVITWASVKLYRKKVSLKVYLYAMAMCCVSIAHIVMQLFKYF